MKSTKEFISGYPNFFGGGGTPAERFGPGCVAPDTNVLIYENGVVKPRKIKHLRTYFEDRFGAEEEQDELTIDPEGFDEIITFTGQRVIPLQKMYTRNYVGGKEEKNENNAPSSKGDLPYIIKLRRGTVDFELTASAAHPFYIHRDANASIESNLSKNYSSKMIVRAASKLNSGDQVKGYGQEVFTVTSVGQDPGWYWDVYNVLLCSCEHLPQVKTKIENFVDEDEPSNKRASYRKLSKYIAKHKDFLGLSYKDTMFFTEYVATGCLNLQVHFNEDFADLKFPFDLFTVQLSAFDPSSSTMYYGN